MLGTAALPVSAEGIVVDLQARAPQTGDAVILDPPLPGKEFFLRKSIAMARFLETDGAATHCSNNLGLAPCDPAFCVCRRQVGSSAASAHQNFAFGQSIGV